MGTKALSPLSPRCPHYQEPDMLIDWWGYSPFVPRRMLDKISRANGWRIWGIKRWIFIRDGGLGILKPQARPLVELGPLASALEMELGAFESSVERCVVEVGYVAGFRCQDGILVHPTAFGLAIGEMAPSVKRGKVRKRRQRRQPRGFIA